MLKCNLLQTQPHIKNAPHVACWQQAFMCTVVLTAADKINGVTRESISTVNKALPTARGNNLLLQFNSLQRNARSSSSGRCLYSESKACGRRQVLWKTSKWKKTALLLIWGRLQRVVVFTWLQYFLTSLSHHEWIFTWEEKFSEFVNCLYHLLFGSLISTMLSWCSTAETWDSLSLHMSQWTDVTVFLKKERKSRMDVMTATRVETTTICENKKKNVYRRVSLH